MSGGALISLLQFAASSVFATAADREPSLQQMMSDVSDCVVERQHDQSRDFVLNYPVDPRKPAPRPPSVAKCNGILLRDNAQVTFLAYTYRYALADALVRRDFAAQGPANLVSAGALRQPQPLLAPATDGQRRSVQAFKSAQLYAGVEAQEAALGECIVRTDPETSRQWLLTAPGSAQDAEEAQAIVPAFHTCAKRTGGGAEFNGEVVRGPVALNYFRLATAASHPGATR